MHTSNNPFAWLTSTAGFLKQNLSNLQLIFSGCQKLLKDLHRGTSINLAHRFGSHIFKMPELDLLDRLLPLMPLFKTDAENPIWIRVGLMHNNRFRKTNATAKHFP